MEKLYDIKIKDEYVYYFKNSILSKGFFTNLKLTTEKDGYYYFKTPNEQYAKIPDAWIDLMLPSIKVEEYPYDLYYNGYLIGKTKFKVYSVELCGVDINRRY